MAFILWHFRCVLLFKLDVAKLIIFRYHKMRSSCLKDSELLQQFKAIAQMNEDDKQVVKKLIDAFITKGKLKQLAL